MNADIKALTENYLRKIFACLFQHWNVFPWRHIFILQTILDIVVNIYILPLSPFLPCQFHQTVQGNMQCKQDILLSFILPGKALSHRYRCVCWTEETRLCWNYSLSHAARATVKMFLKIPKKKKSLKLTLWITVGLIFFSLYWTVLWNAAAQNSSCLHIMINHRRGLLEIILWGDKIEVG